MRTPHQHTLIPINYAPRHITPVVDRVRKLLEVHKPTSSFGSLGLGFTNNAQKRSAHTNGHILVQVVGVATTVIAAATLLKLR
jgi:hypothetical protein